MSSLTQRETFESRLEEATKKYVEAIKLKIRWTANKWKKRIEWCDKMLAEYGEW